MRLTKFKGDFTVDIIKINDMRFYGNHGVFEEETTNGQYFRVNARLKLNAYPAGVSDNLEKSVSYADVYDTCKTIVEGKPYKLLEAVAHALAEQILQKYELVEEVEIEVIKERPPIVGFCGEASVEILRKQRRNIAYMSLGTNMGDRVRFLSEAIRELNSTSDLEVSKTSSIYETKAVGLVDQADFLNQVVKVKTSLTKYELLELIQKIEYKNGRDRVVVWGPRTLDIDILIYNNETNDDKKLLIPHPRIAERAFVLVPFAEMEADVLIPGTGKTVKQLLDEIPEAKKNEVHIY